MVIKGNPDISLVPHHAPHMDLGDLINRTGRISLDDLTNRHIVHITLINIATDLIPQIAGGDAVVVELLLHTIRTVVGRKISLNDMTIREEGMERLCVAISVEAPHIYKISAINLIHTSARLTI